MKQSKNDDPIIFFTLIDFLIQLLFVCLLVFAAYISKSYDENDFPDWTRDPIYLPVIIDDLSPYITKEYAEKLAILLKRVHPEKLDEVLRILSSMSISQLDAVTKKCTAGGVDCSKILGICSADPEFCQAVIGANQVARQRFRESQKPTCEAERTGPHVAILSVTGMNSDSTGIPVFIISNIRFPDIVSRINSGITQGMTIPLSKIGTVLNDFRRADCVYYVEYRSLNNNLDQYKKLSYYFYTR